LRRVAVVYGDTGNGTADVNLVGKLITRHPQLRGLINVCPGEAVILPQQVIDARKVGKIFSAGNGGTCPPLDMSYFGRYVRRGAEEIVCPGDPVKLGYLVVWAADYLASGHTFALGRYRVGSPVGNVTYDATDKELPLGRPLTITKANLGKYAGK
jgi:hypothetical protein